MAINSDTEHTLSIRTLPADSFEFFVPASAESGARLISVSLPAPQEQEGCHSWRVSCGEESVIPQVRVVSESDDGSPRTLMVRFPWTVEAGQDYTFRISSAEDNPGGENIIGQVTPYSFSINANDRSLTLLGNYLTILRNEATECGVQILAPNFPARFMGPEIKVIENGPYFAWVYADYYGGIWNARLELKADLFGEIEFASRLLRTRRDAAMPRYGFRIFSSRGRAEINGEPMKGKKVIRELAEQSFQIASDSLQTSFNIPGGPQFREGQLQSVDKSGVQIDLFRSGELESRSRFLEGQERSCHLVMLGSENENGRSQRIRAQAAVSARRAAGRAYPETDWGAMLPLRKKATSLTRSMQVRDGEDFGRIRSDDSLPMSHLDATLAILEDYYRGGDVRLLDWAMDTAEYYLSMRMYRGWDLNAYGGERNDEDPREIESCNQTGTFLLLLAYDQTGDPRFRESAIACVDRVAQRMEQTYFMSGYSLDRGWSLGADVRGGYFAKDLIDFYRYTGEGRYLETARNILRGIGKLRLGEGLWKEEYSDPYGPTALMITGEDVGILHDTKNFENPFHLTQILLGAQAVYSQTENEQARKIVSDISDWLVASQSDAGLWNFPQAGSPAGQFSGLSLQISKALLNSYILLGEPDYFQAAESSMRLVTQLLEKFGSFPEGIPPQDKKYFYTEDFTEVDFLRSKLNLEVKSLSAVAGFFSAVNEYIHLAFDASESLRQPISNPLGVFLLEEAEFAAEGTPLNFDTGARFSEVDADFQKCREAEAFHSTEEAIDAWERFVADYVNAPLESFRVIQLAREAGDTAKEEAATQVFLNDFPGHPRSGLLRLKLAVLNYSLGEKDRAIDILKQLIDDLFGSVWERDASALLYLYGDGPRPEATLLAGKGEAETITMIDPSTGDSDELPVSVSCEYDESKIRFAVECRKPVVGGVETIRLYLDPAHDYESWCCFEVSSIGDTSFRELSWAGQGEILKGGDDWVAKVSNDEESWHADISIPLEKLGLDGNRQGELCGLNIEREFSLGLRLWQSMHQNPVMPQAFGRLLFC